MPFCVIMYTFLVLPPLACFSLVRKLSFSKLFNSGYNAPCLSLTSNFFSACFFIMYPHIGRVRRRRRIWMSSRFLVMRCTSSFLYRSDNSCTFFLCPFSYLFGFGLIRFMLGSCFGLCLCMLLYASSKHERLYDGLVYIETQDMSYNRHIVSASNRQTVEQRYRKTARRCQK